MLKRLNKYPVKTIIKEKVKKTSASKVLARAEKPEPSSKNSTTFNEKAQWKAFRKLEAKVNKKLAKLKSDFKKDVSSEVLIRDIRILGLLGGECNYMLLELEKAEKRESEESLQKRAGLRKMSLKKVPLKKKIAAKK